MFSVLVTFGVAFLPFASAWDAYSNGQISLGHATYADGLFTPVESLSSLSTSEFTTLGHPFFPHYSVRVKKSQFCDETVNAYTGYIDVEARHLFFYFFESPGCSSSLGLFMELGPCRIPSQNGTVFHPESWNTNANVFFVDQPIGVGFSYADHGEFVGTSEEAAKDIAAFVSVFFENFSQFKGRAFHMSGESYGGRYLPLFAAAVYDQNAKLVEAGLTPINLQSVMIGNGMTDSFKMILSYYDMQCSSASVAPIVDIGTCVTMKTLLPRCEKWMKSSCEDQYDAINCGAAVQFCRSAVSVPYHATGKNPYDISKQCEGNISETLCYPQTKFIRDYLDKPSVRSLLGVDSSITKNFTSCAHDVGSAFGVTQDILHPTKDYVAGLLERGVRVLIYVGAYDWICNHVGNERWTLALEWSGHSEFAKQELKDWVVDGKSAGKTRSAKGFTFATIAGAGHMVPYDKPKESLEMVKRWIAGPCRIPDANGTVFHPESWNTNANIFFIDQPVGVGFSYAKYGEYVDTSEEAAKDVAAFVAIFFEKFDQFKGRSFHMAGESYGGRYLPLFASAVYDQNSRLIEAGLTPINLQSVVIGNGLTDTFGMVLSYYDMQCTKASAFPLIVDIESCVAQKALLKRCETWMKASCEDQYDAINCRAAYTFCSDTYSSPFLSTGMNPYDMSKVCEGDREETLCYPQNKFISDYLDTPSVRTLLGVDSSVSRNFSGCSRAVEDAFQAKSDITYSSKYHVAALLERGIRFLIYVGTNDYLCNYIGNEKWTVALEWSGQSEFSKQELRDWLVNGKRAGKTRSAQGFTYATVIGAGHMVPFDKPQESLELIQRWIAGKEL
ncbi:hypothetical protein CVT25_000908 [Psilocybe cyanescens]|uniref:Carboxypeptidase n=1 Tax=Psilocybe cyanescens TaxID=93625 RepID=A0A409WZF1_PSICY|nr:hypothetical protein CVT25_000908 [Psilocybe cyanescens]